MKVVTAHSADELAPFIAAWDDLSAHTREPNPFYESWMLMPALRSFAGSNVAVALILGDTSGAPQASRLVGLFPLEFFKRYRGLPLAYVSMWQYLHCYLCSPLVRRGCERECLEAFFTWLDGEGSRAAFAELRHWRADDGLMRELLAYASASGRFSCKAGGHERALFVQTGRDAYFQSAFSGTRLREYRKKRRKIAELGELQVEFLERAEEADRWAADFIAIERAGWKGVQGGALAMSPASSAYFQTIVRQGFERRQLFMMRLAINGEAVAMKCGLLSGAANFGFKITYDERYGAFSPGLLLELDHLEYLFAHPEIAWADSCADPEHPLFSRIYKLDRRAISTILVSRSARAAQWVTRAVAVVRWMYKRVRRKPRQ